MKKNFTLIRKSLALVILLNVIGAMIEPVIAQTPNRRIHVRCSGHGNGKVPDGTMVFVYPVDPAGNPTLGCICVANSCQIPVGVIEVAVDKSSVTVNGLDSSATYKAGFGYSCSNAGGGPCFPPNQQQPQNTCIVSVSASDVTFTTNENGAFQIFTIYYPNCPGNRIGENDLHSDELLISPNPALNIITVDNGESAIKEIEIYNALGVKVISFSASIIVETSIGLDVTILSRGIYFVKVKGEYGERIGKFVKE